MNINGLTSGFQVYSGSGTQAKISVSQEKATNTQTTGMDTVEISSQGKMMAENAGSADLSQVISDFMDGAGNDGVITLDEILAYGEKYRDKAEQILDETLEELNISSDAKITISSDSQGNIEVSSDLSQEDNEKLEQALNDDPDFQQHYTKAASSYSLYDAGMKQTQFAQAYENNPDAVASLYGLGDDLSDFVLEYLNGES